MGSPSKRWMVLCLLLAAWPGLAGAREYKPWHPSADGKAVTLRLGSPKAKEVMGYGWVKRDHVVDRVARWIDELEADVRFEVERPRDLGFTLTAAPRLHDTRRQCVGLFVNGRYVTEWVCAREFAFSDYTAVIPAKILKPGTNTLTLRMGYRRRAPMERRELSLAVDKIVLRME